MVSYREIVLTCKFEFVYCYLIIILMSIWANILLDCSVNWWTKIISWCLYVIFEVYDSQLYALLVTDVECTLLFLMFLLMSNNQCLRYYKSILKGSLYDLVLWFLCYVRTYACIIEYLVSHLTDCWYEATRQSNPQVA